MNKSIKQTRNGFAYQDKFSLLIYLDLLLEKKIKEFYVDYPYNNEGNSLDVFAKVFAENSELGENIYEIKAKEKIKNGDPTEWGETLISLYKYGTTNELIKRFLIVEPELKSGTIKYWSEIKLIHDSVNITQGVKSAAKSLLEKLQFNNNKKGLETLDKYFKEEEFISFLKTLEFKMGHEATKSGFEGSDIDALISDRLGNIAKKCSAEQHEFLLTNKMLINNLISIIVFGASQITSEISDTNINDNLKEVIIDFFARRRLVGGRIGDDDLSAEKKKINEKLNDYLNIQPKLVEIHSAGTGEGQVAK